MSHTYTCPKQATIRLKRVFIVRDSTGLTTTKIDGRETLRLYAYIYMQRLNLNSAKKIVIKTYVENIIMEMCDRREKTRAYTCTFTFAMLKLKAKYFVDRK